MNLEPLMQLATGGIFCVLVLKEVFAFLDKRRRRNRGNGEDDGENGCTAYTLLETIRTQNKAILRLLEMEEEQQRVMHRVEKTLDRMDAH